MMEFIKEVTWEEANKFMKLLGKNNIEYGMITEWGAAIPDDAKFIIELGDEENLEKNYIATKGFLQRSEDKVFVRLMKDGKKEDMPRFEDIFEIVEHSENFKEMGIGKDSKA